MGIHSSPGSSRSKKPKWPAYVRWCLKIITAITVLGVAVKSGHLEFQALQLLLSL